MVKHGYTSFHSPNLFQLQYCDCLAPLCSSCQSGLQDRDLPGSQLNLQRASLQPPTTKYGFTPFHSDTTTGGSKGSRAPLRRNSKEGQITETWLLLEYCDSGSLQVSQILVNLLLLMMSVNQRGGADHRNMVAAGML